MKKIFLLVFLISLFLDSFAQNCTSIDHSNKFNVIKIGQPVRADVKSYFVRDNSKTEPTWFLPSSMAFDLIKNKKLENLFLLVDTFDMITLTGTKTGIINSYLLSKKIPLPSWVYLSADFHPSFYDSLTTEMKKIFGEPNLINDYNEIESGVAVYTTWHCNDLIIAACVAIQNKDTLSYYVGIVKNDKEKKEVKKKEDEGTTIWTKDDPTWDYLGKTNDDLYLIKREYESKFGDEKTIWFKTYEKNIKSIGKGKTVAVRTVVKSLYTFDCASKRMKLLQMATYNMDGKLIKNTTYANYIVLM